MASLCDHFPCNVDRLEAFPDRILQTNNRGIEMASADRTEQALLLFAEALQVVRSLRACPSCQSSPNVKLHRMEDVVDQAEPAEDQLDDGMRFFRSFLRIDCGAPLSSTAVESCLTYNLGQALLDAHRWTDAQQQFRLAIELLNETRTVAPVSYLHNLGYALYRSGDVVESITCFETALAESLHGSDQEVVAATLNCLGVLYAMLASPASLQWAINLLQQAIEIQSITLGENHSTVATMRNNLGRCFFVDARYENALTEYCSALAIRKLAFPRESLHIATIEHNVGQTFHRLGRLDEALVFLESFRRTAVRVFGEAHADVARVLGCIATVYQEKGDRKKAIQYSQDALEAGRQSLGVHADVAVMYNKLGNLFYESGKMDQALKMYEFGLKLELETLPAMHPNIAVTLSNIGQIHRQNGAFLKALDVYKMVLEIQQRTEPRGSTAIATTLSNIGLVHYQRRDYESAMTAYQLALRMRQLKAGPQSIDVAALLNSIGLVRFAIRDLEGALKDFLQSLAIRQEILGEKHRDVAISFYNIATVQLELGNDEEAVKCYSETLRIEREVLGHAHADVAVTLEHIARIHHQRGELDDSLAYYGEALQVRRAAAPTGYEQISRTLNNIANIHLQAGDSGAAVEAATEAARLMSLVQKDADIHLAGFHLYGFAKLHPPAAPCA